MQELPLRPVPPREPTPPSVAHDAIVFVCWVIAALALRYLFIESGMAAGKATFVGLVVIFGSLVGIVLTRDARTPPGPGDPR